MDSITPRGAVNPRAENGRKGGLKVLELYGREHFRAIGKAGYRATLLKYWAGDTLGYRAWLVRKGWDAVADDLADRELDRQLSGGATVASVELPVMSDDDADGPTDQHYDLRAGEAESRAFLDLGLGIW